MIGSGSGGRAVAGRLADAGLRVAMVESGLVGGECPYWACMPAKTLLRPAEAVAAARRVPGLAAGIDDWERILAFRDDVVSGWDDAGKVEEYRARGVTILGGHGRLSGAGRIEVDGAAHATERVVLATGSAAAVPPIEGLDSVGFWTNREAMELRRVPASAAIVGAGPVGVEIGQMLHRYGCRVTVIDQASRPLPAEDPAVGDLLARRLRDEGIDLALRTEVAAVARAGDGARLALAGGGERIVERVVVAGGRRPRVEDLGLETVGIAPGGDGIAVDERCRAADGVWAVGDVTGVGQFTHVAAYQGRIVCADILGEDVAADYTAVPRSVFCDPEVAAVGLTAAGAREAGLEVAVATVALAEVERGRTYGRDAGGLVGVVADRRRRVLVGAHAVGPLATEWIHMAVLAVRARVPVERAARHDRPVPDLLRGADQRRAGARPAPERGRPAEIVMSDEVPVTASMVPDDRDRPTRRPLMPLEAPQMVTNSRMLYLTWVPADPDAVRALTPDALDMAENNQCFMNQYVVDSEDQTSGFAPYSLTYLGPDLSGLNTPDGAVPGRWWTHYFNSNADMRAYASQRGVPAEPGETVLEISDGVLTATSSADGVPIIRTTATVGDEIAGIARGQLRYITEVDGTLTSGLYPFVLGAVQPWAVTSLEFLEPSHPVYALRPAEPLEVTWGFYSPNASFCYPGGEGPLGQVP